MPEINDLDAAIFGPTGGPISINSSALRWQPIFLQVQTGLLHLCISADAIVLSHFAIPSGRFMLDISIADTSGNTTEAIYWLAVGLRKSTQPEFNS
jgi:hypothetical protein